MEEMLLSLGFKKTAAQPKYSMYRKGRAVVHVAPERGVSLDVLFVQEQKGDLRKMAEANLYRKLPMDVALVRVKVLGMLELLDIE